jgi:hypothetical protein
VAANGSGPNPFLPVKLLFARAKMPSLFAVNFAGKIHALNA